MKKYYYNITQDLEGKRVDKVLTILSSELSRSQIQKYIKNNNVLINGKIISNLSHKVMNNDEIELNISEKSEKHNIAEKNIPLDIIYEDEYLIVINKNSNMTVHPGAGNHSDTLVNALLYHTKILSDVGGQIRPGIVHRLDKSTSGLMVVAKNNNVHNNLADQIKNRKLIRKYKALIWGVMKPTDGIININIARDRIDRTKMTTVKHGGKYSLTHYKTLEILHGGLFSFVECTLETGRTHQIRVHMSHVGHSIVGDQKYGNNKRKINGCPEYLQEKLHSIEHQLLHSFYIRFIHPVKKTNLFFQQGLPIDYNNLYEYIRNFTNNL